MKIRIFSDLHLDVNFRIGHEIPEVPQDDVLNIICGDISGDFDIAKVWLHKYIKNGIFIKGNHCEVYCPIERRIPVNIINPDLVKEFPTDSSLSYLDFTYKVIDDIVFIGVPLWTDYKLGKSSQETNMLYASGFMNDFVWGKWQDELTGDIEAVTAKKYLTMHERAVRFLRRTLKKFKDKKCVLITHHGMSEQCIDTKYKDNPLNASYVSNMDKFIKNHPNIVLICSGHTHITKDFMVGNTRYIINAYGYGDENPNYNNNLVVEV